MKTLICLLSDQPVPNLMSCKTLHPERIVLVETSKMQKKSVAINFQEALKKMNINVETRVVSVPEGKDNNFPFLTKFFDEKLYQAEDQFYLNLTGGTKPMSIALYETFKKHPKADFYYFDVDHPCKITDFRKNESFDVPPIPLDAFLAGYGYQTSKDAKHIESAENTAVSREQTTNLLARKCNDENFRIWSADQGMREWIVKAQKKDFSILTSGLLVPSHPEIAAQLAKQFSLHKSPDGSLQGMLSKYDIKYLDGCWLEEFVWITLNKYKEKYQMKDLHLGQKIQKNGSENELDVSFMRNNMLYVLECKTGLQEKMQENQYKLFAVSKQVQAIRTKTFLISNSKKIMDKEVQERAQLHSTTLVNADQIHQMAEHDPEKVLDELFNPQKK